jgi:outer membrane protein OmpA-like peptidoglycan-associated protein
VLAISGHTDYQGTDTYNWDLALWRARAVQAYLRNKGVRLKTVVTSFGEDQPVAGNADYQAPEEMALNRRVEFVRMQ